MAEKNLSKSSGQVPPTTWIDTAKIETGAQAVQCEVIQYDANGQPMHVFMPRPNPQQKK